MRMRLFSLKILGFLLLSVSAILFILIISLPALASSSHDTQSGSGETATPSPNPLASVTIASTQVFTPTDTPTPYPTQYSYMPNLLREFFNPTNTPTATPPPLDTVLFCDSLSNPLTIPDNYDPGVINDISIPDGRFLVDVRLYLDISHSYVGDLVVTLSHQDTLQSATALHRPGSGDYGCSNDGIVTILGDTAASPADDQCASYPYAISGIYLPKDSFSIFTGQTVAGTWRLNVSDHYQNDTGTLNHWCLATKLADTMPAPTPPPTPIVLPPSAYVAGLWGQHQKYKLDCESRSAVDWARHYGFNLDEDGFLNHLPRSDDPEVGFVGDPNGSWGQIPPNDYGVHAAPVASLLRDYGLTASGVKSLSWDELRSEIASGNPVIVWIIGDSYGNLVNGVPHYYTSSSTGKTTIVAPHEHTVIVVGYSAMTVTVLNGAQFMDIDIDQFLDSWSVLDFMAVVAQP